MPKPIKRKVARQEARAEDTMRTFMTGLSEKVEANFRQIVIVMAAVLAVIFIAAGYFMFKSSAEKSARGAFYEGYKLYHGLYDAGAFTEGQRLERALENFRKAYDAGGSPQALMYIANVQYAQGNLGDAIESLERLVREFPDDEIYAPLALYKAAMVQSKAGKPEEALKYLEKLDSLKGGTYKDLALVEAAGILESLGKKDEAIKKYESLIERYPESPFAEEAEFKLGKDRPDEKESAAGEEGG